MQGRGYLLISSFIFLVVSAMHWVRVALQWGFQFGPIELPMWLSVGGGLASLALAIWGFRLATRR